MSNVHFSSKSMDWSTPQEFFDKLDAEFHFTLDAAASHNNAKCDRYITKDEDGLNQRWENERVYLNPPYGREIGKWIEKAATEPSEVTVMLIPARTDTKAWHQFIFGKAEVRFIPGRLKFGGGQWSAPFPSAVIVFRNEKV